MWRWLLILVALWCATAQAFTAATLRDDFNRANQTLTTSSNWSQQVISTESGVLNIVSNAATWGSGSGQGGAWWNVSTFGADSAVSAIMPDATTGSGTLTGLFVRLTSPSVVGATNGYICTFFPGNTPNLVRLERITNSARTTLTSTTAHAINVNGMGIGCEMVGSTLKAFYDTGGGWTEAVSATDANHTGAGYTGIWINNNTLNLDDFGACTLAGGVCAGGPGATFFERRRSSDAWRLLCQLGLCLDYASWRAP